MSAGSIVGVDNKGRTYSPLLNLSWFWARIATDARYAAPFAAQSSNTVDIVAFGKPDASRLGVPLPIDTDVSQHSQHG